MPTCKLVSSGKSSAYDLIAYMQNAKAIASDEALMKLHMNRKSLEETAATLQVKLRDKLAKEETVIRVRGNMGEGTPTELAQQMEEHFTFWNEQIKSQPKVSENGAVKEGRHQGLERQYLHFVAAYDPKNTPELSACDDHLHRTMEEFLPDAQWTASLHQNKDHKHWHIAVASIDQNGKPIKTDRIWERMREISDRHAKELGISVLEEKEIVHNHAVKPDTLVERRAKENDRTLDVTYTKNKVAEVLQGTTTDNILDFRKELLNHKIELKRRDDSGSLVYSYNNRHFSASRLGNIHQYYGIRQVQKEGYEKAAAHIESLPREADFRTLNADQLGRDSWGVYSRLPIGQPDGEDASALQEENERRKVEVTLLQAKERSKDLAEFHALCHEQNIQVVEKNGRYSYIKDSREYKESDLSQKVSSDQIKKHFAKAESQKISNVVNEYKTTQEQAAKAPERHKTEQDLEKKQIADKTQAPAQTTGENNLDKANRQQRQEQQEDAQQVQRAPGRGR